MFGLLLLLFVSLGFAEAPAEYQLGPGDEVHVIVHGHDFGRDTFVVGSDGTISFPYVGLVDLKGLTAVAAERTLRDALMKGYLVDPQVSIRIKEHGSQRVDLLGAVAKPGVITLSGPTTIRALVTEAGGAVQGKASGAILVNRDGHTTRLMLANIEGPEGDFLVHGGDVVDVELGMAIYMAGEVANPGAIAFSQGITASQALLQAGGHTDFGRLSGAYVVRGEERIHVNLKRILKGKEADMQLQPGDRVVIPVSAL
ncbi:MAG: polysaccharide biosynthesis/export family protein [Alphaproteobacteria bacterium]|nr:polysaccharide biosynthesis/export family protein [Alphaproteobacteria bacterium]